MAASYYPPTSTPYAPITAPTAVNPIGFNNSGDARTASRNQRQIVAGQGDALQANDQNLANQYAAQSGGTQDYLNPIENTLATGGGGYNPTETAAINYSPEEQQQLITNAGISAGVGTASSVGAAERAAAASGGNPAALATYRARAAQTQGANAGDAMTAARVAAKGQEAAGATNTGTARLNQQNEGLGYYGGLQSQQNTTAQNEQGLQQGAYGTETSGTGAATGQVLNASQTPSTFDKITGFVSSLAGPAASLIKGATGSGSNAGTNADGNTGYLNGGGTDAIVGEDGPEVVVGSGTPNGRYMAGGGFNTDDPGTPSADMPLTTSIPASWLQKYLANIGKAPSSTPTPPDKPASSPAWNKATPYAQLGTAIGSVLGQFGKRGSGDASVATANSLLPANTGVNASGTPKVMQPYAPTYNGGAGPLTDAPLGASKRGGTFVPQNGPIAPLYYLDDYTGPDSLKDTPVEQGGGSVGFPAYGQQPTAGQGYGRGVIYHGAATPVPAGTVDSSISFDDAGNDDDNQTAPSSSAAPDVGMGDTGSGADPSAADGFLAPGSGYRPVRGMMADGGISDADPSILDDYLSDSARNELTPAAVPAPAQGGASSSGSSLGSSIGTIAKAAIPFILPFLADGSPGYRPKMMMAEGGFPPDGPGISRPPQTKPPQIITSPTRVKLDPGDKVVPLSYRPKAKIRPSAALPALMGAKVRPVYGMHA